MSNATDYKTRVIAALIACLFLGVLGVNMYEPALDLSQNALAGIFMGLSTLALFYALETAWKGLRNRRIRMDRRHSLPLSFTDDRRVRDLGPSEGEDRREGEADRRIRSRRNRFASMPQQN